MSLVWESEPWWEVYAAGKRAGWPWWQVRRSEVNPALLTYYASEDKASRDLWTQIKPGRFLTAECSAWLTPKQIKYWAEWQSKGVQPTDEADLAIVVLFATTPDDIEEVYINGPASCMSSAAECYSSTDHPVRVYGAGDLAIAYLPADPKVDNPPDDVIARAICWPERKVFGRIYPTIDTEGHAETLRGALHALGYRSAHECEGKGLDGAKMLRIEEDDGLAMPYLDNPYQAFEDHGDYLILRREGDFTGTDTDGVTRLTIEYDHTCENCEEGFDDGGAVVYLRCNERGGHYQRHWCDDCVADYTFTCAGFDETFSRDVAYDDWGGDRYTQVWLNENTFISDFNGDCISNDDRVEMHNGDVWSDDEFDRHGQVLEGENWPNDDAEAELDRRAAAADEAQLELMTL